MTAVIGVPGYWESKEEIIQQIIAGNDDFICAGSTLINTKTQALFELEVYDYDPDLKISYAYCGRRTFTDEDVQAVDEHTYTVYVIGESGSPTLARELLKAGGAVLKAGGVAVKIESSGGGTFKTRLVEFYQKRRYNRAVQGFCDHCERRAVLYILWHAGNRLSRRASVFCGRRWGRREGSSRYWMCFWFLC